MTQFQKRFAQKLLLKNNGSEFSKQRNSKSSRCDTKISNRQGRYLKSVPRPSNPSTCGIFLHGHCSSRGCGGGTKLQQDFLMKREHLNVQTQVYDQNHIVKQRCCWSQIITNLFIDKVRINQHNEVERGKKVLRTSLSSSYTYILQCGLPKRQTCLLNKLDNKLRPDIKYQNKPNG